ncbi:MAG: transglycosylase SLT domain-containing protein [Firmicutes bacterium]|nr:transglycosylase SLT domain-containing protein [Bacillota bacterium]
MLYALKGGIVIAQNDSTLDQQLQAMAQRAATRRALGWALGGGLGCTTPLVLGLAGVIGAMTLVAGVGQWFANPFGSSPPPPLATPLSRPAEWLPLVTATGAPDGVPNVLALAVLNQASDGQVYGDRYYCSNGQSAGEACDQAYHPGLFGIGSHDVRTLGIGRGLFGLDTRSGLIPSGQDPHDAAWNAATGLRALGRDLAGAPWQTALTAFHAHVQAPPGWTGDPNYASQIQGLIASYDAGPTVGAWALAPWSDSAGTWEDPGHTPEWVFVVAAAPAGPTLKAAWSAPTTTHTVNPRTGRVTTKTVAHPITYRDLALPVAVWGRAANGRTVNFQLSTQNPSIPVWPGGTVWGAQVPLTGSQRLTQITARWADGVQDTIAWPEQAVSLPGTVQIISNQQALDTWWRAIQVVAQQTGVPADLIAAVMIHESGGVADAYNPAGPAYGLMQILNTTAPGLPGYNPATWTQPQENLILGAELLQEDYQDTGGTSWQEAIAAYYGGLRTMEHDGFTVGMPWSEAQTVLNVVPDPQAGNTETMTAYADQMMAEAQWVAVHAPIS